MEVSFHITAHIIAKFPPTDSQDLQANSFIFYGHSGDFTTNRLDEQELAALSLHLLQICLVYILSRDFVVLCSCHTPSLPLC